MALCFPQLATGALTQYPIRKSIITRTLINECHSGAVVKLYDAGARRLGWEIHYAGITREEMNHLLAFFDAVEGRLHPFTWIDPTGNLLAWSEDLTEDAWVRSAMLGITSNISDPLGGIGGTTVVNTSQIAQRIEQTLGVPGSYVLSFSGWIRADSEASAAFSVRAGDREEVVAHEARANWQRFDGTFRLEAPEETVTVGVSVPSGASITIFGLQVTAQPYAGEYRRTAGEQAIWQNARFDQDDLVVGAWAEDSYQTAVRVTAPYPG